MERLAMSLLFWVCWGREYFRGKMVAEGSSFSQGCKWLDWELASYQAHRTYVLWYEDVGYHWWLTKVGGICKWIKKIGCCLNDIHYLNVASRTLNNLGLIWGFCTICTTGTIHIEWHVDHVFLRSILNSFPLVIDIHSGAQVPSG